ncbi:shikimate dehydrogenase [Nitzschia inconspicua]|uniref:Shikimate dehydrogenase n=1 Tax=Nitzschia inconspicua TaxID=303405 RepID=A0A9K3LB09_9STRA|nr:shikimate dehydrogenase [Nitzschia inconspicua]
MALTTAVVIFARLVTTVALLAGSAQSLTVPSLSSISPAKISIGSSRLMGTSTTSSVSRTETTRIMFHDYDRPIVLIGCSSEGKEMKRLAKSFLEQYFPHMFFSSSTETLIHQASASTVSESVEQDQKIRSMANEMGGWPNFILLDFAELCTVDVESERTQRESEFVQLAKELYSQKGLLSIYINVETESGMSKNCASLKKRLENDVLLKYSDYELCIKNEGILPGSDSADELDGWEHIKWELARLVARARLEPATPGSKSPSVNTAHLTMGDNTFFLSLSFPKIEQVKPYVEEMCVDVDAMEYRTDLLDCRDSRFDLIYGMQQLRKYCRPHVIRVPALPSCGQMLEDVMPIVYTVRTQNQAGTYPDDQEGIAKMFDMLEWGLRAGVEVLDVESAWDKAKTDALLTRAEQRYSSQILGSHHVVGKEISTEEAVDLFQQCALDGRAHGAKVVLSIESEDKDRMAHQAALLSSSISSREGKAVIPNISLILGEVGRFSRVINLPFTPVTHESLPFKAAPGQLTASEIMAARVLTKIITTKRYAILGHNIAYSVSPQMQGSAFAAVRLPHQYGRADVKTVEEFVESNFFKDPAFGGCSVTIPHKQSIIPYVDVMSESASRIGSVNTLIVEEIVDGESDTVQRVVHGDNTDWKGIYNPLERKIGVRTDEDTSLEYALILGGGGTARAAAYAASKLGLKRIYYNRTPAKAQDLADSFGGTVVSSLEQGPSANDTSSEPRRSLGDVLPDGARIRVVISTLPASAEFVLPEWLLTAHQQPSLGPVIFDVNYKPYQTKLLTQAEEAGLYVVRGSEMLWEQGVGQFEAWTKRTAPYAVMKTVVLQNCLPQPEDPESFR